MKIAYLDCSSGISGDMFVGALLDAGVPLSYLQNELSKLPVKGYALKKRRVRRCGIRAAKFDVIIDKGSGEKPKKWRDVQRIIRASDMGKDIREKGLVLFRRLFEAEAKVHGKKAGDIHLHELGAVDCMVDVFGALVGVNYLGIEKLYASPVNLGSGVVKMKHGSFPVPSPATLELLRGLTVYTTSSGFELTTPTGALLVSHLCEGTGEMPPMKVKGVGYGAGSRDDASRPNVARMTLGEMEKKRTSDDVVLVETNIDDMNPQFYGHVMDLLFQAGALDVFMTSVFMKKNRPGIKLSALVYEKTRDRIVDLILSETTSIGVRFCKYGRVALLRESVKIKTRFGTVTFKKIFRDGRLVKMYPEYDDCSMIARRNRIPIGAVLEELVREGTEGLLETEMKHKPQ
jgi:uncharacterized protein (TIGR00299 family) protein